MSQSSRHKFLESIKMTLKELIKKHTWEDVKQSLLKSYFTKAHIQMHYSDGKELVRTEKQMKAYAKKMLIGYEYVFFKLLNKKAVKEKENWTVFATYCDKQYDGTKEEFPYWSIHGQNGQLNSSDEMSVEWIKNKREDGTVTKEDEAFLNQPISYALEFKSWSKWLSMTVDDKSLSECGESNFIAHCLWEMTFCGFEERQINNKKRSLDRTLKSVKDGTAKLTSFDSVDDFKDSIMSKVSDNIKLVEDEKDSNGNDYEVGAGIPPWTQYNKSK